MTTAANAPAPARQDRAQRGAPIDEVAGCGVPVGKAPAHLRTQTQLGEQRLKLAPQQRPLAYLRLRKHGDVPPYDPQAAVKMRPLPGKIKRRQEKRRTCPVCSTVRDEVVYGGRCSACRERERRARAREQARTCWTCHRVCERPLPTRHHQCPDCRREQLAEERLRARTCRDCQAVRERSWPRSHGRCGKCRRAQPAELQHKAAAWIEEVTVCAAEGCTARMVTKAKARAHLKAQGEGTPRGHWWRSPHWPTRCGPCREAHDRHVVEQARRRALEAQERERQRVEQLAAWAREILADERTVILDTETTGLDAAARIVEISVITAHGEVLLDTLLDPCEPIPREATDIHGIGDQDVAGAPSFSDIAGRLANVLAGRRVVIYNATYDIGRCSTNSTATTARTPPTRPATASTRGRRPGSGSSTPRTPWSPTPTGSEPGTTTGRTTSGSP